MSSIKYVKKFFTFFAIKYVKYKSKIIGKHFIDLLYIGLQKISIGFDY